MDRITEAIAHFIGLFDVTVDEARQRAAFEEFTAEQAVDPEGPDLPAVAVPFKTSYEFVGYVPGLLYRPFAPEWIVIHPWTFLRFERPEIPADGPTEIIYPGYYVPEAFIGSSHRILMPEVETLGSVATYLNQGISLSDNDYFGVGGHGLFFATEPVGDAQLIALVGAAARLSPIIDLEMAGSSSELAAFVTTAAELLEAMPENPESDAETFVEKVQTIEGTFVNGEKVEEAPKLEDHYTFEEEPDEEEENYPTNARITQNGLDIDASVTSDTGGNTLVNNAVLKSLWTASPVMAVAGKYIELNAIIQINAWSDNDYISSALGGWLKDPISTAAFNIATFERTDPSADDEPDLSGSFPEHWVVKEVEGDLMIVNWLQQFTFMMDNDIGILSSSGVTTSVYSGGNLAHNDISIYELGFAYDLIVIGGNVYDANIIHQLNALFDNDVVGAVSGFETTGEGSIATSGNLLWNEGYIYNVGGADRFEPLPQHYRETAERFAKGDHHLNDGVRSDAAFAGNDFLRVLYIKGDLLNVQYLKQTNMLGDSDQVALAMHEMEAHPDAKWSIATGGNALLNNAAILDLDALGKTYVGDGHYSSEVLVQADIISTDPEFGGQNPDVLVNEAVAFLDEDMLDHEAKEYTNAGNFDADSAQADGLQTLIG